MFERTTNAVLSGEDLGSFLESILRGEEENFCRELMELFKEPEFSVMKFEGVVDRIRVYVAEVSLHCFQILVGNANRHLTDQKLKVAKVVPHET